MYARTNLDPQLAHLLSDIERTADRPCWTVKRGIEAVTCGIDFDAVPPPQCLPNDGVVSLDQVLPGMVPEGRLPFGRGDDVSEQDGGEDGLQFRFGRLDADESLDLSGLPNVDRARSTDHPATV
jgi:hypothetical protein